MTKLRSTILGCIEVAGVITIAAMAPNVLSLIGLTQKRGDERLLSAVTRLKKKGLVRFDGNKVGLTVEGRKFLMRYPQGGKRSWRWDKKWRVVIFDIPEERKEQRKTLRDMLKRAGFLKLQQSVWVFPYDCEELIMLLKTEQRLYKEVLYMIVDTIERDSPLRAHFGLP